MKIGIDLGSTYSGFARYDYANNRVEPISLKEGEPLSVPSVVFYDSRGRLSTGSAAKTKRVRKRDSERRFEHFKMLLNEDDPEIISSRGYDRKFTPRYITSVFLEDNLRAILKSYNDSKIEKLCICVPELWGKGVSTLDGRSILIDMLYHEVKIPIEHVQVVTEPEAASAFFAFNYEVETKKEFDGYLLLIDYGGGTLDITLTEVDSSGRGSMEICYRDGCGAGENHLDAKGNRIIGNAGVSYIQEVVLKAISGCDDLAGEEVKLNDPDFVEAFSEVENTLKSPQRMQEIEDFFASYGSYSDFAAALDDSPEEFMYFTFRDVEVSVSYQCLYETYRDNIEKVLSDQIEKINAAIEKRLKEDPCKPASGLKDNFKIALVGGFVGCYFVRAQLYEIYNMDAYASNDPRIKNISTDKKEQAISLGAALIAADKVKLQKTARYSIGLMSFDINGNRRPNYGIKCNQIVTPGKPYFMLRDDSKPDEPNNRCIYANLTAIKAFMIEFTDDLGAGKPMILKQEMLDKLNKDLPEFELWNCGFSLDESDVVSFHVVPIRSEDLSGGKTIRLDNFRNLFEVMVI